MLLLQIVLSRKELYLTKSFNATCQFWNSI